jgi:preprotein translocase subunit SecG
MTLSKHRTSNAQRPTPNHFEFDVRCWTFGVRRSAFASGRVFAIFRLPMNLLINLCLVLFVLVAALMVFVILMQRPKSEGLGAAFGGGVTENIFGAQTTNVLVKFTTWLAGIFFALTFALSVLYAHQSTASSAFRRELMKNQAVPQTSPAPAGAQSSPGITPPAQTSPAVSPAASAAPAGSPKS